MGTSRWTAIRRAVFRMVVLSLLLLLHGIVAAQSHHKLSEPPGSGDRAYEGTLSCLRPDRSGPEADKANCRKEGQHERVLIMKQGYIHLLYGASDDLQATIHTDAMLGKTVKVKGKIDPITGAILVNEIVPVK